jgi:Domain of unknown function (DUF3387)
MDVERLFEELTAFTRTLDDEEKRHLKEGLEEDELAVFDILTRPDPRLTRAEELEVKKVARQLLEELKGEKFILDWRLKENAKADVREDDTARVRPPAAGLRTRNLGRQGRAHLSIRVRAFRRGLAERVSRVRADRRASINSSNSTAGVLQGSDWGGCNTFNPAETPRNGLLPLSAPPPSRRPS